MTMKIGILSDTHLSRPTEDFRKRADACFKDAAMIFHAGDITDPSVLDVFRGKEVHAVCGNMCSGSCYEILPRKKIVRVAGYAIGLIHAAGSGYAMEDALLREFDHVDCIVFGHTHAPLCRREGAVLLLNPGSFASTGRYGAPGTYALLELGEAGMKGTIHEVPRII